MLTLKSLHIFCAYFTGFGFLVRGILLLLQSPFSGHRLTKVLPHIVDTVLLASGVTMFLSWSVSLSSQSWLVAKIVALLIYIGFGMLMIRWGTTATRQWAGLLGGLTVYAYIIGAAHSKSVLSFFAVLVV